MGRMASISHPGGQEGHSLLGDLPQGGQPSTADGTGRRPKKIAQTLHETTEVNHLRRFTRSEPVWRSCGQRKRGRVTAESMPSGVVLLHQDIRHVEAQEKRGSIRCASTPKAALTVLISNVRWFTRTRSRPEKRLRRVSPKSLRRMPARHRRRFSIYGADTNRRPAQATHPLPTRSPPTLT